MLTSLLGQVAFDRQKSNISCPVLVKPAPDLTGVELDDIIGVILDTGMDEIIATNTTIAREGLRSMCQAEPGGLSGSPLAIRSEVMLDKIVQKVAGRISIVSAGEIMSPEEVKHRLGKGAALVKI